MRRPRSKNIKGQDKRICPVPHCGKEMKNVGRFCGLCTLLYYKMKNHTKMWKDAGDEKILAKMGEIRKREKDKLRAWKESYRKEVLNPEEGE